jgi:hypothetical protein
MGKRYVIAIALAAVLAGPSTALALTQTASSGNVTATFSFTAKLPPYRHEKLRLEIVRGGRTAYDARVVAKFCGSYCGPLNAGRHETSVHVVDLEPGGEPDVVLDLYSGGAHCCVIEEIFSFDSASNTYVKTEHNFGDPGESIVDLGHNGQLEFVTANDAFAYEFTDYAASGMPIDILTFSHGRFHDVTKSYPELIAKDAAIWLKAFKSQAHEHPAYQDTTGVIAAWAADECNLGECASAFRYVAKQAKAGHLNSALGPPSGRRFVAKLGRFLRKLGYLG